MDAEEFEDLLLQLNSPKCMENEVESLSVLEVVSNLFTTKLSLVNARLYTSSTLDEELGIVPFIKKSALKSTHSQVVMKGFDLIEYLIINYEQAIPHSETITKLCIYVLRSDAPAKSRESCMKSLKTLLDKIEMGLDFLSLLTTMKQYLESETKPQSTVYQQVCCVSRLLLEKHPDVVAPLSSWFLKKMLDKLTHEKVLKDKHAGVLNGCLEVIDGYLVNFDLSEKDTAIVYNLLKTYGDPQGCSERKRLLNRSALHLLGRHCHHFQTQIYEDCNFWFHTLFAWMAIGSEDSKVVFPAAASFYRCMARLLEDGLHTNSAGILENFLTQLNLKMSSAPNTYTDRIVFLALGELVPAARQYPGLEDLTRSISQSIISVSQQVGTHHLPVYLKCISKFVSKSSWLSATGLVCLRQLSVRLIEDFPDIPPKFQDDATLALEMGMICAAGSGPEALDNHLREVVYQGIIRSCLHPLVLDVELVKTPGVPAPTTYKSFVPLWASLLNMTSGPLPEGVSFEVRNGVASAVYDSFVTSFIKIVKKLNLTLDRKLMDVSDPDQAMEANKPEDFKVFVNSVDLFQEVIPTSNLQLLSKWITLIIDDMILLSTEMPLVSGFYKVLSTVLTAADQIPFFDSSDNEKQSCLKRLGTFLEHLLVKVDQLLGDLQVACLQTILSAPLCIVESFIDRTGPIFQVILRVGSGYPPLWKQCISTLDRWNSSLPSEGMKRLFTRILPYFDMFLQSRGPRVGTSESLTTKFGVLKTRGKIRKRLFEDHSDSQLAILQRNFLELLSKLDPDVAAALTNRRDDDNLIPVTSEKLSYMLPFPDLKSELNLNDFLPRIIDLAVSCGDRETRWTACEILHACATIAVGRCASMCDQSATENLRPLFNTCLVLGCDSDVLVNQLFNGFVFQLAHFFSSKRPNTNEVAVFIEVLIDNVTHPFDASLRDFSAKIIREFIIWSIKQLDEERKGITAILRFVLMLSVHPRYSKRLGAALIVNNIYTVIREDKHVLDVYWVQLYFHAMKSLSLCEQGQDHVQFVHAVDHLSRPLQDKPDIFNKQNPARKVPTEFEGGCLDNLLSWTHKLCLSPHARTREVAMSLVLRLAPKLPGCTSVSSFLSLHVNVASFVEPAPCNDAEAIVHYEAVFAYARWMAKVDASCVSVPTIEQHVKTFAHSTLLNYNGIPQKLFSLRCACIVGVVGLVGELLHANQPMKHWLEDAAICSLISTALFQPSLLGFHYAGRNHSKELASCMKKLLNSITQNLLPIETDPLRHSYRGQVKLPKIAIIISRNEVEDKDTELVDALQMIHTAHLWNPAEDAVEGGEIVRQVFDCLLCTRGRKTEAADISPSVKDFLTRYLSWALTLGVDGTFLLPLINNGEAALDCRTFQNTTKGEYFASMFKEILYGHLVQFPDQVVDQLLEVPDAKTVNQMIWLTEFVVQAERGVREGFATKILLKWGDLQKVQDDRLLQLMKNTCQLMENSTGCLIQYPGIVGWILDRLNRADGRSIETIFSFLPAMTSFEENVTENLIVLQGLLKFWNYHPFFSKPVASGTAQHSTLVSMCDRILDTLARTGSLVVLKFTMKIVSTHADHISEETTEAALSRLEQCVSSSHFNKCLELMFDCCLSFESSQDSGTRWSVCRLLLAPALRAAPWNSVKTFILDRLPRLHELVTNNLKKSRTEGAAIEVILKSCSVLLIQAFYCKTTVSDMNTFKQEYTDAKQMLGQIFQKSCVQKTKALSIEPKILELVRQYNCVCFNLLCVIASVYDQPLVYKQLFDQESKAFWHFIVDECKVYTLTIDFDELPKRRKVLTALRKTITAESQKRLNQTLSSVQYLQTPTVFTSTLNDDVTKFDFVHSSVRPMDSVRRSSNSKETETDSVGVELELDVLNEHECMATACGVVEHMMEGCYGSTKNKEEIPVWLESILKTLEWSGTNNNTRLFLLKMLCNLEKYVRHHFQRVVPTVIRCICRFLQQDSINYFIIDLMVMITSWDLFTTDDAVLKQEVTEMLKQFIEKTDSHRMDVIKNNLEIVKTILEVWKVNLILEDVARHVHTRFMKSEVSSEVRHSDEFRTVNYINLHLIGALLGNRVTPWDNEDNASVMMKKILKHVCNDKYNHKLAAEVCGMVLKFMEDSGLDMYQPAHDKVCTELRNYFCISQHEDISRLYCIHKHYSKISSDFVSLIRSSVWKQRSIFHLQGLEMLASHARRVTHFENDTLSAMIDCFLVDMMRKSEGQELVLELIHVLFTKLKEDTLDTIVNDVEKLCGHRSKAVRKAALKVLKMIFEKSDRAVMETDETNQVKKLCKAALLRGLVDGDEQVEEFCLQFWQELGHLQHSTCEKLSFIMHQLHDSDEQDFLSYATLLTLEITKTSADYKLNLFDKPLSQCTYKELQLLNYWRAKNTKFVAPMFAQTIASQMSRPETLASMSASCNDQLKLLNTIQSLMFEPTAAASIPEEVLDAPHTSDNSQGTYLAPPQQEQDQLELDPNFKVPRRRFRRDAASTKSFFARKESLKKERLIEAEKERLEKLDSNVKTYRSYRSGDFPDIEISHSHVVQPLQVLARKDPQIARQLLTSVFTGILNYFGDDKQSRDEFLRSMVHWVEAIMRHANNANPSVTAFLFHVCTILSDNIELKSHDVASMSIASGLLSSGALLMENVIVCNTTGRVREPKQRRVSSRPEDVDWINLATLYHEMKDFDAVRGIFLDSMAVEEDVIEAIHCESVMDWSTAAKLYKGFVDEDNNPARTHFYTQSYLSCMANLSKWQDIVDVWCTHDTTNSRDKLWEDPWTTDKILPMYLKASMMESLSGSESDFQNLLSGYQSDKQKLAVLRKRFLEELTVWNMKACKHEKAQLCLDQYYEQFQRTWNQLDMWCSNMRTSKLSELQSVAELHQVLNVLQGTLKSTHIIQTKVDDLVQAWERNLPKPEHDLLSWDVKLTYRRLPFNHLTALNLDLDLDQMHRMVWEGEMNLIRAALEQSNFYLARKYLLNIKKDLDKITDSEVLLEWDYYRQLCNVQRARQTMTDVSEGVQQYLDVWKTMDEAINTHVDTDSISSKAYLFKMNRSVAYIIRAIVPWCEKKEIPFVAAHLNVPCAAENIAQTLRQRFKEYMNTGLSFVKHDDMGKYDEERAEAHLQLAKFCMNYKEEKEIFVHNLLQAMVLGSKQARQLFCGVLTMPDLATSSKLMEILEQIAKVPTWMFLLWTNQLLAHIDTPLFVLVKNIVERIANEYPNAMRYSFHLSKRKYQSNEPEVVSFVSRLSNILSDVIYDNFCKSISFVTSPYLQLKYYLEKVLAHLQGNEPDWVNVELTMATILEQLHRTDDLELKGPIYKKIAEHLNDIEALSRSGPNVLVWKESIDRIRRKVVEKEPSGDSLNPRLRSYSPWLVKYQGHGGQTIEIPGQYEGIDKPLVKYHAVVSSFKPEVTVLQSKTKPIKITILGNDAVEYRFIVKFGEDLRQDQRIQQVFKHINQVFAEYKHTKEYSLDTFAVIPLSTNLGLIQWVDNTKSLQELMCQEKNGKDLIDRARTSHIEFLRKGCYNENVATICTLAYLNIDRTLAVSQYNARVHSIPDNLLRNALWSFSSTPEHFFYLRSNFAKSQATMFVAHWLVGIGDRHLQNTLVSTRTGRTIGIDFGYAFGFATYLKPPELIPFRLTPQICNVYRPLQQAGWIKQAMIRCLRELRKDPAPLMATLELFVLEPSVDWIEHAKKHSSDRSGSEMTEWYPQVKLSMVRRKLEGANPVALYVEDLEASHSKNEQLLHKFIQMVKGTPDQNIRARMKDEELTEEEQVDCLVDQAMDPCILAYTYIGWDPWL